MTSTWAWDIATQKMVKQTDSNSSTGLSSSTDSNPPSSSPSSTSPDSSSWREESTFLNSESSNEQLPSLEPVTETSCDQEPEPIYLIPVPLVNQYQAEATYRALNEHQKRKFSRLRKRVWDLECDVRSTSARSLHRKIEQVKEKEHEHTEGLSSRIDYIELFLTFCIAGWACWLVWNIKS